jgi:hypothetical protein
MAAVVCVLAFAQSAAAQCTGWQPTPEARRQCCKDGACPQHRHDDSASSMQMTQSAADECCAVSERHESRPSPAAYAPTITMAVLQSLPPVIVSLAPMTPPPAWESPSPPTHVPKHLLLSVFLV